MKEGFLSYWRLLINDIPHELFIIALIVLVSSLLFSIGMKGFRRGMRYSTGVLLIEYICLIYCSTVFFRNVRRSVQYDYMPFWSYQAYFDGREPNALIENMMNILVFVPIGLLLGLLAKSKTFVRVTILGACISIGIEFLQLIFKKGFSELDDVMHNTLGCVLGYGILIIIKKTWNFSMSYYKSR